MLLSLGGNGKYDKPDGMLIVGGNTKAFAVLLLLETI